MKTFSRRAFLGMTGITGAGLCLGLPVRAHAAPVTETRVQLGTYVGITLAGVSAMQAEDALGRAFAEVSRLERMFSRFDGATPVSELNRAGRLTDAPTELSGLVNRARRYGSLTDGAFDITVQPVVDLFRAHRNPRGDMELDAADLAAARELVGLANLRAEGDRISFDRQGMGITLDGIAKGYIADRASARLCECGVTDHIVNAGGDIMVRGMKAPGTPWRIGVASPDGGSGHTETVSLTEGAIATSGTYEVYYDARRKHHHLVDPVGGRSPDSAGSVSVIAPTVMEADALATALSVIPPQDALRLVRTLPGRACCIFTRDGRRMTSANWSNFA